MTAIEKLKNWLLTCPGMDFVSELSVDFTDQNPANGGIFPAGVVEIGRKTDVLGHVFEVVNQYNFALYMVFEKAVFDAYSATLNAEWIAGFQEWVQEQSIKELAPSFGDVPSREVITAQNGALYEATEEGIGTYIVQLSIQFVKRY